MIVHVTGCSRCLQIVYTNLVHLIAQCHPEHNCLFFWLRRLVGCLSTLSRAAFSITYWLIKDKFCMATSISCSLCCVAYWVNNKWLLMSQIFSQCFFYFFKPWIGNGKVTILHFVISLWIFECMRYEKRGIFSMLESSFASGSLIRHLWIYRQTHNIICVFKYRVSGGLEIVQSLNGGG